MVCCVKGKHILFKNKRETSVLDAFNGVRDCITCVDETRTCRSMREYCTVRLEARL